MEHIFSKENRPLISNRLKFRTGLFLCIAVVMFVIMAYDIIQGQAEWWMAVAGVLVGFGIGFVFGRLARVRWHESEEKIVTQNDATSIIIIVVYVALSALRGVLLRDVLSGAALLAVSFALASGILFGRFVGMHVSIMRLLRERRS